MKRFIDEHRDVYGVESICKALPIAPSTYYNHAARYADPSNAPPRIRRDETMCVDIQRIWEENFHVYGARKVRKQLRREGYNAVCCTVKRLMRRMKLRGVIRGKPVCTTDSNKAAPCPMDRVNR